jgi:hypothetical protein
MAFAPLVLAPRPATSGLRLSILIATLLASLAPAAVVSEASAERCVVADAGGIAEFPALCERGYRSVPRSLLAEFGGGDYLVGRWLHTGLQVTGTTPVPGGKVDDFTCDIEIEILGLGLYSGYARTVVLPAAGKMFSADQVPGPWSQDFPIELLELAGTLPAGDPDFDLLRITAGTSFGLPGPGRAAATKLPSGQWNVDSFFDITYRIDWAGAPGGPFAGTSGSTPSETRIVQGELPRRTHGAPDPPHFPPSTALTIHGYRTPTPVPVLIKGLPETGHAHGHLDLRDFAVSALVPNSDYAGQTQFFSANVVLDLFGTGIYSGFQRQIVIPVTGRTQTGPITPLGPFQSFPSELLELGGQILGDPDFTLLDITAGTLNGFPGPGHTSMTALPGGNWSVDSFFDITYRIEFVGAPGGTFAGLTGATVDQTPVIMGSRDLAGCLSPDIGGTARFPADCPGGYRSPTSSLLLLNGLPPQSPILAEMAVHFPGVVEAPGGPLGGHTQSLMGNWDIRMHGLGALAGFLRTVSVPFTGSSASGPRGGGTTPQSFPSHLSVQGQIVGDPDFDLLRITAVQPTGMPSPGHTVFGMAAGGNWTVDSFFDITYRVDFIGAPGGPLAGMSGSTTAINRFQAGVLQNVDVPASPAVAAVALGRVAPNPTSGASAVALDLPVAARVDAAVFDLAGRRVAQIARGEMGAGRQVLQWEGRDSRGAEVGPGLYFFRIRLDDQVLTRRVVVQR